MYVRKLCGVTALWFLLACGHAHAVTQIEDNYWGSYTNLISTQGSTFWVTFIARATAADIASGVLFSIEERDPEGNDRILDVALPWSAPYPAKGTEIRVTANYQLACSNGALVAHNVRQWFVTWCDLDLGTQVRYGVAGTAIHTGSSEPESFEFVLLDEDGVEAEATTPEDAYSCAEGAVSKSESPFMSLGELARQDGSIAAASTLLPRYDPEIQLEDTGVIQVAFDPDGRHLCGRIPVGTAATLYVIARPRGPTLCGLTGAELRIEGIPEEWIAVARPAGQVSIGDPLGPVGGNVAFTTCQMPQKDPVLLYTITLLATTEVTDLTIEVLARNPPANLAFDCPLVTLCDLPLYSIACMRSSGAVINSRVGASCGREHRRAAPHPQGKQSLEPSTWSAVKVLYR